MKKNRVNLIEAHFEKVILAGVSVVLLGVVSMQFLTQPNAVKVGNEPNPVPPGSAFDPIAKEAERLLAQMRNPTPDLPEVPEQNVAKRFEQVRQIGLASSLSLSHFGTGAEIAGPEGGFTPHELTATVYAMPSVPVPSSVAVATNRATLDPFAASSNPALMAYLPAQQPFDAVAVSVEGAVSGDVLRQSLESDPDGDGPKSPLPLLWWRDNIDLLGVEVQREEQSSGGWINPTVIAGMPGEPSLLGEARRTGITANELSQIARDSAQYLREIAQPKFPPTIAGPDWVRPSEQKEEVGMTDEQQQVASLKRRVESYDRSLDTLHKQLDEVGSGGGGQIGNERSVRGGGGTRGGRPGEGGGGGQATDPTQRRRESIQRSIDATERNRQRVVDQLKGLGVTIGGDADQAQQTRGPEPALPQILNAASMPVWVNDFSAEQGKMYRYRMRVVVNNPLFGRAQFLSDDQKGAAQSPTLEGAWSDWSEPIRVEDNRQYFVVSASEDDQLGTGPRAAVEVYEFYYGYWRKGSTTLSPGDMIHTDAKLPENLPIWDAAKLKELARMPGTPTRTGGGGGRDFTAPGRQLENREGEMDERMRRVPDEPRGRPGTGAQPTEEGSPLPEGATAAPTSLELDVPAMLLDVVSVPGEDQVFRAVLRGPDGSLVTRDASSDRSSPLYKRLAANAREGVDQGRPEPEPTDDRRPQLPTQRRQLDEGGGGGGAGGG